MQNRIKLAFFTCLLASPLLASDPPPNAIRLFIPFVKSTGYFNYLKSDEIPDTAAQLLNNLDWSVSGVMQRRRTVKDVVDLNPSVVASYAVTGYRSVYGPRDDSFWIYHSTTNHNYYIMRIEDTLENAPVDNGYYDMGFSQLFSSGSVDAIQVDGNFYMASQTTAIIKVTEIQPYINAAGGPNPCATTGSCLQLSSINGSPSGNILRAHLDTYLVAGSTIPDFKNTVFFSSAGDIESWPINNTLDIFAKSNEHITCIGDALYGNVPIYTNTTTRLITGTEYPTQLTAGNIIVRLIYDGVGCSSQKSVKNLKNKQYFYSAGEGGQWPGIYEFNGVSVNEKTIPMRSFFRNIVQNSTSTLASAFIYKSKYCLNVPTSTVNWLNTLICLDVDTNRLEFYQPSLASMADTLGGNTYFVGNTTDLGIVSTPNHHVYKYDIDDKDDFYANNILFPFTWIYQTKDFPMEEANVGRPKQPERLYFKTAVSSVPSVIQIQANYDFGKTSTTWFVDPSTFYGPPNNNPNIVTISSQNGNVVNLLKFTPGNSNTAGSNALTFNNINFSVSGSTKAQLDYLDFYAIPQALKN